MKKTAIMAGLVALATSACTTADIHASKSIAVQPHDKAVIVQTDARTICKDYFFVQRCELYLEPREIKE